MPRDDGYMADLTGNSLADESDETLMALTGTGDKTAYSVLVSRHVGRAVGLATRLLGNVAEAEDVVQEVMTKVWINAPRWQAPDGTDEKRNAKFTTWFYRVLRIQVIDRQRKKKAQPLEDAPEPVDESRDAHDMVEAVETSGQVRAAIATLPEKQRLALTLCFYEGFSNAEAAEQMDTTVKAIESLLVRARRSLRDQLASVYEATKGS
ncbi:MAG: hypothetical protein Alpg2KO_25690 [Alphaproteobacteria bacterium]